MWRTCRRSLRWATARRRKKYWRYSKDSKDIEAAEDQGLEDPVDAFRDHEEEAEQRMDKGRHT